MKLKLFPFNQIPPQSNVVIYGMGPIGEGFVRQIRTLSYCNIVACLDKNYKNSFMQTKEEVVLPPEAIKDLSYDYVIVATVKYKFEIEANLLNKFGLSKDKIILLDDNYYIEKYTTPALDWTNYYMEAERNAPKQFHAFIEPVFNKYGLSNNRQAAMDFACGRGRIANLLKDSYSHFILCDISSEALDFCRERFESNANIEYMQSLPDKISLDNKSLDVIYSWDAMVHFNYKMLDIYISEFSRVLKDGGYCFIHHSNIENSALAVQNNSISEYFYENSAGRAKVSKEDVARIARRNNFDVLEQNNIDWGVKDLDCITVLLKLPERV